MDYTTDTSYKQAQAEILGSLTTLPVATGSQLVGYSGFKQYAGLREQYSADLDFGTGEWTASAWVNIPTLATNDLPTSGVNLLPNNGLFYDTDTNNIPDGWASSPAGSKIEYAGNKFALTLTGTNGVSYIANTLSLTIGKVYKISAYIEPNTGNPYFGVGTSNVVSVTRSVANGPGYATAYFVATESTPYLRASNTNSATFNIANYISELKVEEVIDLSILSRSYSSGAKIDLTVNYFGRLGASVFDGTNTRIVITDSAYSINSWIKVEAVYTPSDTALVIRVNGQTVKSTTGTALLSMNNSNAQLTIGNNFNLDAPFPGSIALAKLSATAPTAEQSQWMYEQEKQLFSSNVNCTLPDTNSLIDLSYDDETNRLIVISNSNESYWSGLVRVDSQPVTTNGSFTKVSANSGIRLISRSTTDSGVDVKIPAYNIKTRLEQDRSDSIKQTVVFDYDPTDNSQVAFVLPIGFTAIAVYKAGIELRETISTTKDWSRSFDGFRETITLTTAPASTEWIQIHATKEN